MTNVRHTVTIDVTGERELKQLQTILGRYNASMRAVDGVNKQVTASNKNVKLTTEQIAKANRVAALQWQNFGYQIQDIAVQMAAGAGAMRTLGQQLPQMTSGFGIWGVAIGTVVAVLGAIIPQLIKTKEETKSAADATTEAVSSFNRFAKNIDIANTSIGDLEKSYGRFAETVRSIALRQSQIDYASALQESADAVEAMNREIGASEELEKLNRLIETNMEWWDGATGAMEEWNNEVENIIAQDFAKKVGDSVGLLSSQAEGAVALIAEIQRMFAENEDPIYIEQQIGALNDLVKDSEKYGSVWKDIISSMQDALQAYIDAEAASEEITKNTERTAAQEERLNEIRKQANKAAQEYLERQERIRNVEDQVTQAYDRRRIVLDLLSSGLGNLISQELDVYDTQVDINNLTKKYVEELGKAPDEARRLAEELIRAENSADILVGLFAAMAEYAERTKNQAAQIASIESDIAFNTETAAEAQRILATEGAKAAQEFLKGQQSIEKTQKLAERYQATLGLTVEEAYALAEAEVASENAVSGVRDRIGEAGRAQKELNSDTDDYLDKWEAAQERLEDLVKSLRSPATAARDEIQGYIDDLEFIAPAYLKAAVAAGDLAKAADLAIKQNDEYGLALIDAIIERQNILVQEVTKTTEVLGVVEDSMSSAIDSLIDGTATVEEAFSDMITGILKDLARLMLSSYLSDFLDIFGSTYPGIGDIFFPASGTRSANLQTAPSSFTAPVVLSAPAPVSLTTRTTPLAAAARTASSSSGLPIGETTVNVYNNTNAEASVQERQTPTGKEIDVYIENKVKNLMGGGKLDKTMQVNYGIRRRA